MQSYAHDSGCIEVATLPKDWNPRRGLHYPTTIIIEGQDVIVESYREHHHIINKICMEYYHAFGYGNRA